MSKMLSKMNLISVVQQLPKEDIETIQGYVEMIEEEHEKLKKQLEELKEEKQEWINLLAMFKNQQKEFIEYLEDYLKLFDNKDIYEEGSYDTIEEILQKYKSIIGVSNENNKQ